MKLAQPGRSSQAWSPQAACGLVGNAHPALCISMLHKETGCHTAAAQDRLLFYRAPPAQPRETMSAGGEMVGDGLLWPEFPPELARVAGSRSVLFPGGQPSTVSPPGLY